MSTPETEPHPAAPEHGRFSHTVDRSLVHRRSVAETYVTGFARRGENEFSVWAQWPRSHVLYCHDGRYHPTLALETFRQAVIAVCHTLLDVPWGTRFIISRIAGDGLQHLPRVGVEPASVHIVLRRTPGPGKSRSGWEMALHIDGAEPITGSGDLVLLAVQPYTRLRGANAGRLRASWQSAAPVLEPDQVRREHARDVCLTAGDDDGYLLFVDQAHPIYYDHPLDHVPGALVLEASFQAAAAFAPDAAPTGISATFPGFLEPDEPCRIGLERADDAGEMTIRFSQSAQVCAVVTLSYDGTPARRSVSDAGVTLTT